MTDEHMFGDDRTEIDRRLETVLEIEDGVRIPAARTALAEGDDRWFGQLLIGSYRTVSDSDGGEPILSAAAAIELLRGYCRLRSDLCSRVANDDARPAPGKQMSALLAGDYLHSVAYTVLGGIDHPSLGACFEELTDVSDTIVDAFGAGYVESNGKSADSSALIDDTAGALGEGAALLGATLAGVDPSHREHFSTLGRGLGTGRQVDLTLGSAAAGIRIGTLEPNERRLRQHRERRVEAANRALRELSRTADVSPLRPFVEGVVDPDR